MPESFRSRHLEASSGTAIVRAAIARTLPALALIVVASPVAAAPWPRPLIDGVIFFASIFAVLIYALAARIHDGTLNLTPEEKKERLRKRLPIVMAAFFGACGYIAWRSMVNG